MSGSRETSDINEAMLIAMTGGIPDIALPKDMRVPVVEGKILRRADVYPHGSAVVAIAANNREYTDSLPSSMSSRLVGSGGY